MGEAAKLFTTSVKRPVCTICNKTFSTYQALGRHKSVHNKQKNSLLGDGTGSSNGNSEQCASNYVCRKCSERFPDRKALGRHIHKHWRQIFKKKPSAHRRKKLKPPVPLPHGSMQSLGPIVLPTDKSKQLLPVLITRDNMYPTSIELVMANTAVRQPPTPDVDAVQQQQLTNRLGNETESPCSTVPKILDDTGAALTTPKHIPPAEKYVFDLNMLPHETDVWDP